MCAMSDIMRKLLDDAQLIKEEMRAWRRHIHQHPERSFEERETRAYVEAQLRAVPGFQFHPIGETGLCAEFHVDPALPTVAARAELDALGVEEESGGPFASQNPGVAHVCGHDTHIAMLIGAAKLIAQNRAQLTRNVKYFFQHAEETPPGGAVECVAHPVFEDVSEVFALHNNPRLPAGALGVCRGPFMAASSDFTAVITGRGGHAALPHLTVDPVVAAAECVTSLQTIISRSTSPFDHAVISVCRLRAGDALNAIPQSAEFGGTIRSLDQKHHESLREQLRARIDAIAAAHGATARVDVGPGFPATINTDSGVDAVMEVYARVTGGQTGRVRWLTPFTAGDDFAYFLQKRPGCYFMIGSSPLDDPEQSPGWHSPRFGFNEEVLPLGAALLAGFAFRKERL